MKMRGSSVAIRACCLAVLVSLHAALAVPGQEPQKRETTLPGKLDFVHRVAFSPDGELLAAGDSTGAVVLWNIHSGKRVAILRADLDAISALAFAPDGTMLAVGSGKHTCDYHNYSLAGVEYKKVLATGEITLWENKDGRFTLTRRFESDGRHDYPCALRFGKDGTSLFSGQRETGAVMRWDLKTGKSEQVQKGAEGKDFDVDLSKEANCLIWGDNEKNIVKVRSTTSGATAEWQTTFRPYLGPITASADGKRVAAATRDIRIWDSENGKVLATLHGHKDAVFALAFNEDRTLIASGSGLTRFWQFYRGELRLWDAVTGKHIATYHGHKDNVSCIAFSPDGKLLASGAADGTVMLWPIPEVRKATESEPSRAR